MACEWQNRLFSVKRSQWKADSGETYRVAQHHALEKLNVLGQGRTHEERLVDLGQEAAREDLRDVGRVTVREDEVGLVDREGLQSGEGEGLGLEEG